MNKCIFMGRLTRDPEVRYGGANNIAIANFQLAVDRRFKREGQPEADFFRMTAFGKTGEFVEKYLKKGTKVVIEAECQNDNYEKEGQMHFSQNFIVQTVEFAESKKASESNGSSGGDGFMTPPANNDPLPDAGDDFMNIPDITGDDKVPF